MIGNAVVFAAATAYFLLFRSYGFQLEDEGNILLLLQRVVEGQRPYLDFHTGYTPGFYALGEAVFRTFGGTTESVRLVLALNNALCASLLYSLARRATGRWTAALAPLLWVLFLPVFSGEFASFNVPYPAWFATLAWLVTAEVLTRWVRTRSVAWLFAAGLTAAGAFSMKLNAGAFSIAAATFVVTMTASTRSRLDNASARGAALLMALGVVAAFGAVWRISDGLVHLAPLLILAGGVAGPLTGRLADRTAESTPGATRALLSLYIGFALPTAYWALPLLYELGLHSFLEEVLLLGSGAADLYYTGHPPPETLALALCLALITFAGAGRLVRAGRLKPAIPCVAGGIAAALGAAALSRAPMPESFATSILFQLENAAFWLVPVVNVSGIVWLLRSASSEDDRDFAFLAVLVPAAVAMYWQLFPRTDFAHVMIAAPLSIVLGVVMLGRVLRDWENAAWPAALSGPLIVRSLAVCGVTALLAIAIPERVSGALECVFNSKAQLANARARVCLQTGATDEIEELAAVTAYLERVAERGENVLGFPALASVVFLAGQSSPLPHDYWYPGRPSREEEAAMIVALEANPPRYVVTINDGWTFFHEAPAYFSDLREFVTARYGLVGRFGRFDVLALGAPEETLVVGMGPIRQASAEDVAIPLMAARRQVARRWMRSLTVAEVSAARLRSDATGAVLQLRAIRDGGDLRTAAWILEGFDRPQSRVRTAAIEAMAAVVRRFRAASYRWADDLKPEDYRPYLTPVQDEIGKLEDDGDERVRQFGRALAGILRSRAPVGANVDSEGRI